MVRAERELAGMRKSSERELCRNDGKISRLEAVNYHSFTVVQVSQFGVEPHVEGNRSISRLMLKDVRRRGRSPQCDVVGGGQIVRYNGNFLFASY